MIYPTDFEQALLLTLAQEGGLSDDPFDSGGLTLAGVTQATYDVYRRQLGLPTRLVSQSTAVERKDLYFHYFWLDGHCPDLPRPANMIHFDACVNSGPRNAAYILQAVIGARPLDGAIGTKTKSKIVTFEARDLARKLITARRGFYVGLLIENPSDSDSKFINGWLNRMDNIERVL